MWKILQLLKKHKPKHFKFRGSIAPETRTIKKEEISSENVKCIAKISL